MEKFSRLVIEVDSRHFYTNAQATASFLASYRPGGSSALIIEDRGLTNVFYEAGFSMEIGDVREILTHKRSRN